MSKKNWQITSRIELLLAKIAGRDVDLNTMTPPVASNATEELLLEIADRLDRADGGETTASQKDVNFIDYDGTIRYSYTASEFASLTDLPANPSHSGLIAQGWNWSLADAKAYVAKYGKLWIGQMYITDDGKTRIYIHLEEGRTSPMLGCCPNGTVVVDWGDGSATETLTGTSLSTAVWTNTHNYAAAGDYVITLNVTSGTVALSGIGSLNLYAYILRYSADADIRNRGYQNAVQKVNIGENIDLDAFAFHFCSNLESATIPDGVMSLGEGVFKSCDKLIGITIPDDVTSIGKSMFQSCDSLANVAIPDCVTSFEEYAFAFCHSLVDIAIPDSVTKIGMYAFYQGDDFTSIVIPNGVTSIEKNAFYTCGSAMSITISDTVTSIEEKAFYSCFFLTKMRFESTTPPTVSNINAWTNVPADCVISVPVGTLSAYTNAANYPDPATYTYIEE